MKGKLRNANLILEEVPEHERLQNSVNEEEEEDQVDDGIPFTKKMRIETRKIHNISDTLVNAKLGLAMSDDKIWAEGLLIFYEIFRFLEAAMIRLSPKNEHFRKIQKVITGIERTSAFEQDIKFYYGEDFFKMYEKRPSVGNYLKHLQTLEQREPLRLLAYIYHLYMGLLSGGQLLKRKRDFRNRLKGKALGMFRCVGLQSLFGYGHEDNHSQSPGVLKPGDAVTEFCDGRSISDIKKEIAYTMNDVAADLSNDEKNSLIEESIQVFRQNNEIIGSIKRTGITALKNYALFFVFVISLSAACYYFVSYV